MEVILKLNTQRTLFAALLAGILAGSYPIAYAQTTTGQSASEAKSGNSGLPKQSAQANRLSKSVSDTASDDEAIQNLRSAAQALRESIQTLARMPPGEKRTAAIKEGNEALFRVQSAMAALPPELLTANADESNYKKALDKMKLASDRLYSAADALANQPAGKARNDAVKQINRALLQTNEAMLTGLQLYAANDNMGTTGSTTASRNSGSAGNTNSGKPSIAGSASGRNANTANPSGINGSGGVSASAGNAVAGNPSSAPNANSK
jgi:hypothetical protein